MTPPSMAEGPILSAIIAFAEDVQEMVERIDQGAHFNGSPVVTKGWPTDIEWHPFFVVTTDKERTDEAVLRYMHRAGIVGRFTVRGVGTVWFRRSTPA